MLVLPTSLGPYIVCCDVSDAGLGAVLAHNGRMVAYMSGNLKFPRKDCLVCDWSWQLRCMYLRLGGVIRMEGHEMEGHERFMLDFEAFKNCSNRKM